MSFPCHASVMLGMLLSDVEHRFGTKAFRKEWLAKIHAKTVWSDDRSAYGWILPDGAGVELPATANIMQMREAAKVLAQHICGEIYKAQNDMPPTQLEMANPPVDVHSGNFGLENDMTAVDPATIFDQDVVSKPIN